MPRRTDALSRDRIVAAAIGILDADGVDGLTVRALTDHFATGRGAIYHRVSGMDELLALATDAVVAEVLTDVDRPDPRDGLRAVALGVLDGVDAHPWIGAQLTRDPWQPAVFRLWSALGRGLAALGLEGTARSDAGSALANYVLGAAAQHAAGARSVRGDDDARTAFLGALAAAWLEHDPDALVVEAAQRLPEHDDRAQFLAGVDLLLAGIAARR